MAVTWLNLVGTRENLDETIRNLLQTKWTKANTEKILPQFESDTRQPDNLATDDDTGVHKVYCRHSGIELSNEDENIPNGDSIHRFIVRILIDLYADSLVQLRLFEDEVNRILWENRPNNANRINKVDGTASEIAIFENTELQFERIEPEDNAEDESPSSQAELQIWVYKNKT